MKPKDRCKVEHQSQAGLLTLPTPFIRSNFDTDVPCCSKVSVSQVDVGAREICTQGEQDLHSGAGDLHFCNCVDPSVWPNRPPGQPSRAVQSVAHYSGDGRMGRQYLPSKRG